MESSSSAWIHILLLWSLLLNNWLYTLLFLHHFFIFHSQLFIQYFEQCNFLFHLHILFLFFLVLLLQFHSIFPMTLRFLESFLKFKYNLAQLLRFNVFLLECNSQLIVLRLHLIQMEVLFSELVLYGFHLIWICKCIFTFEHCLQIMSQSSTLIHVHLQLYFNLCYLRGFDVTLELFYLFLFD
jgi:hypothetical protein